MEYILIRVIDREISCEKCSSHKEAYAQMEKEYKKALENCTNAEISKNSAWVNADNGNTNCDWAIEEF